jgi:two-component system chemotaxis response regulator CheY
MAKHILIADDSESIREILAFSLERAGFNVLVAADGLDAVRFLDGRPIDLLLTDYHMPNLNGLELIAKVRETEAYRFIPILVLTTEKQTHLIREAQKAGATGWLFKPFSTEKLIETLKRVIR